MPKFTITSKEFSPGTPATKKAAKIPSTWYVMYVAEWDFNGEPRAAVDGYTIPGNENEPDETFFKFLAGRYNWSEYETALAEGVS